VEANEFMEIIQIDHIIDDVESNDGHKYILVVTDVFTRKSWFLPSKTLLAQEVYQLLLSYEFSAFFFPKNIYSDLGSAFQSDLDKILCETLKINHKFSLPSRKGSSGQVENRNKTAENIIRKFISQFDQSNWPNFCWTASYAYNKSFNFTHHFTPDFLVFAKEPFSVVDLAIESPPKSFDQHSRELVSDLSNAWKIASKTIKSENLKAQQQRSSSLQFKPQPFTKGDLVLLKSNAKWQDKSLSSKFLSKHIGPFEVDNVDDHNHAFLRITKSKIIKFHFDDLVSYSGTAVPFPQGCFTPELGEIIPVKIPAVRGPLTNEKFSKSSAKKNFDIKTIVGQRVSVKFRPSDVEYSKGLVIGYDSNLKHNLIFYDVPTVDIDPSEDYYKCYLFPTPISSKTDKWSLLECDQSHSNPQK